MPTQISRTLRKTQGGDSIKVCSTAASIKDREQRQEEDNFFDTLLKDERRHEDIVCVERSINGCKTWQSFVVGVVARRFDVAEVRWWCVFVI